MNVLDMIFHWARERPEQPAIIQPDMIITYKEFAVALNSVAEHMASCKLNRQGPVARLHRAHCLSACGMFRVDEVRHNSSLIHRGMLATLPEHHHHSRSYARQRAAG